MCPVGGRVPSGPGAWARCRVPSCRGAAGVLCAGERHHWRERRWLCSALTGCCWPSQQAQAGPLAAAQHGSSSLWDTVTVATKGYKGAPHPCGRTGAGSRQVAPGHS